MPAEMRKMIDALKENELIPLTFDVMFTEIFNNPDNILFLVSTLGFFNPDNICILEEFISNYLEIPLKDVTGNLKILSRRLGKENRYDSRIDKITKLNF